MANNIFAIDPGDEKSGWCEYSPMAVGAGHIVSCGIDDNYVVLNMVRHLLFAKTLAVEWVQSYGMPVGKNVFHTCRWIGRLQEAWVESRRPALQRFELVPRKDTKMLLCQSMRAKDANVRQAIIDLYPPSGGGKTPQIGTKKKPGPLYGVTSHVWSAIGVAMVAEQRIKERSGT